MDIETKCKGEGFKFKTYLIRKSVVPEVSQIEKHNYHVKKTPPHIQE